eukprot:CAMPEP_0194362936 /NCGR_PEP_ID=MMETSP0174-20130528/10828_1 /TAXON_ID=216777 /ORGANISM="Proboscia alata, Strain PI-D3" /LENGTH=262 /DNA_ID=CAMNT_0039136181 /DNA_START=362 /DNA_END=1150 /DNA_ORIENTATION=+
MDKIFASRSLMMPNNAITARSNHYNTLWSSANGSNNDDQDDIITTAATNELLNRATELRKQADVLEEEMKVERSKNPKVSSFVEKEQMPFYRGVANSAWKISFRGRDRSQDDDDDKRDLTPVFGDVTLHFRDDGYTDITVTNKDNSDNDNKPIFFDKFWGWDEEIDPEDELRYLSFSANTKGTKMAKAGFEEGSQMYFTARVDFDPTTASSSDGLELNDGKITVKRELKTGFWGVFNASGILAEFRDSGDFVCRPAKLPETI